MPFELDLESVGLPAKKVLGDSAPLPARMMAAKGIVPGAKPTDLLTIVVALSRSDDKKLSQAAAETLHKLPDAVFAGALSAQLQRAVVDALADEFKRNAERVESLLRQEALSADALARLAESASEAIGELIAVNEKRLLEHPAVIEKLYLNKNVRMSTADRLLELAVRNDVELNLPAFKEAAAAIQNELIPAASDEPTPDDVLFTEAELLAKQALESETKTPTRSTTKVRKTARQDRPAASEDRVDDASAEDPLCDDRSAAGRLLLVRDTNKLVSVAAAKSPQMRENEARQIASSRAVGEEVLRELCKKRELTRNYQIKLALVMNPRTPFTFASRMITLLRDNDLRSLSKSKNVTGAVSQAARQQLMRKQKRG